MYLDDILIYTKNAGHSHVEAVRWVFGELRKYGLFANLKKCHFHQEEVHFFGYVVSSQKIRMEEERIDAVRAWPELKSEQKIQVFIEFANFYRHFIQSYSKIAAPLIPMLRMSFQPAGSLSATGVDDSKVVGNSGGNERKSAKFDFTKLIHGAK